MVAGGEDDGRSYDESRGAGPEGSRGEAVRRPNVREVAVEGIGLGLGPGGGGLVEGDERGLKGFDLGLAEGAGGEVETNLVREVRLDRKSTRLNSSHKRISRMPSSA